MAFYNAHHELVAPELEESYDEYLARLHRLGFELRPDDRVVHGPDRRVVNL